MYAIALGGILLTLLLTNVLPLVPSPTFSNPPLFRQASRYLRYGYIVRRHRFLGPLTCVDVVLWVIYIAGNSICIGFRVDDVGKAGVRAGNLSLINMSLPPLGPHLGFLADVFGISLRNFRLIHRSAGLMSCCLVVLHVLAVPVSHIAFSLSGVGNISATVVSSLIILGLADIRQGGASLGLIIVTSWS